MVEGGGNTGVRYSSGVGSVGSVDGGGWDLSLGNFRSGKSPFSLNNAIFVCTCLLVLVVALVNYGGGTRRKLFGE